MAFSKTFERELNNLFRQRTDWLRRKLGAKGAGKPPKFGRKKVNAGIRRLQEKASDALARKLAKAEFNMLVLERTIMSQVEALKIRKRNSKNGSPAGSTQRD